MKKKDFKQAKYKVTHLFKLVLGLLYPLRCPVCDGIVLPFGEKICTECLPKLKLITPPYCMKCGKKVKEGDYYCPDCQRYEHLYVRGRALYDYGSVATCLYRFKYGGRREYGDFLGEEMARYLGPFIREIGAEALIPVPLHRKREKKRGYNQAKVLADALGRYAGLPVYGKYLQRVGRGGPLKYLSPEERQNNLKKAFIIKENDVKLKVVIIVDDIYTTGSTVDAVAHVLLEAGVEKVFFLAVSCGAGV